MFNLVMGFRISGNIDNTEHFQPLGVHVVHSGSSLFSGIPSPYSPTGIGSRRTPEGFGLAEISTVYPVTTDFSCEDKFKTTFLTGFLALSLYSFTTSGILLRTLTRRWIVEG
jgi:hypothetical protein